MEKVLIEIEMENGDVMKGELYPEVAPITVENFLKLIDEDFFAGLIFHRVIPGFMIQGGGYTKDFKEKQRVLKEGAFLVEFLPEESEVNFDYLYEIKKMAQENGFKYFAKVAWKKGNFISNTGRKSKNVEDVMIFSNGEPRSLKLDAKKNLAIANENNLDVKGKSSCEVRDMLQENNLDVYYMKGTNGMLPTAFDYQPKNSKDKIIEAEKPVELIEEIIEYISKPYETLLDQYAGSGNFVIACYNKKRNCIAIEKNKEMFEKMKDNIESNLDVKFEEIDYEY